MAIRGIRRASVTPGRGIRRASPQPQLRGWAGEPRRARLPIPRLVNNQIRRSPWSYDLMQTPPGAVEVAAERLSAPRSIFPAIGRLLRPRRLIISATAAGPAAAVAALPLLRPIIERKRQMILAVNFGASLDPESGFRRPRDPGSGLSKDQESDSRRIRGLVSGLSMDPESGFHRPARSSGEGK